MKARAVLGIDLGTSYFKAGLFSPEGRLLGMGRVAVEAGGQDRLRYEIPPPRFQSLVRDSIGQALAAAHLEPRAIEAVSYSSQANSFLLLDGEGAPLTPVVLWQDRRVEKIQAQLELLHALPDFLKVTGFDLTSALQCPPKLLWFRDSEPGIWARTRSVMTVSDYLCYLMTGERAGDSGTACLLGLWDLARGVWWKAAMEGLGLDAAAFSRLYPPGTVIGTTCRGATGLFGLPEGLPFAVGSLDHHMAAIGSGVGTVASVLDSTGTVIACFTEATAYSPRPGCAQGPGLGADLPFWSLAFHDSGAVVLEWYRREYASALSFDELSSLAEAVPAGSGGLVCRSLADSYPDKEGFLGQEPGQGHGHFARAIMESIAGEFLLLLSRLKDGRMPDKIISTGGGSKSEPWLRIKANLTGSTMLTTGFPEAACAGAAMLAAAAAGWFATPLEASASWVRVERRVEPDPEGCEAYRDWYGRYLRLRVPAR